MMKFVRVPLFVLLLLLTSMLLLACQADEPEPSAASAESAPAKEEAAAPSDAPAEAEPAEAEPATETDTASTTAVAEGLTTFTIVPEQSEVRFTIDEVLRGSPKTVVGATSQLNGQIFIDPVDPSRTEIGPIQIDASSFATDDDRRNGAIRRFILQSNNEAYQFITFTPTSVEGLPAAVNVGDTFELAITGDLTIRDEIRSETFVVAVTVNSETEISGSGSATILYKDYGISIPSVPFVASVEDDLLLEIDFVATTG